MPAVNERGASQRMGWGGGGRENAALWPVAPPGMLWRLIIGREEEPTDLYNTG